MTEELPTPSRKRPPHGSNARCSRSSASSSARTAWSSGCMVCLLARGHCLLEGVPGLAKTLAAETLASTVPGHVRAHPVHPRPHAVRPRRHADLPAVDRALRRRARPGLRQLRARRRDQPRAGQGAVGAPRGDGRAPGVDRRRHAPRARPVPRARDAEPDRVGGRVPAPRGAARPLPHEGRRSATRRRPRSSRSSPAWASIRRRPSPCSTPTRSAISRPRSTGLRRSRGDLVRGEPRLRDARRRRTRASSTSNR